MRCRYCLEPAGWWRRHCRECRTLLAVFNAQRGTNLDALFELWLATGATPQKIERFLDADPTGQGSVRDRIAADMTNELLAALGQRGRQSVADVRRARQRGTWTTLDRRPRE